MKLKLDKPDNPEDEKERKSKPKPDIPKRKTDVSITVGTSGKKNVMVETDIDKELTPDVLINAAVEAMRNSPDIQTRNFAETVYQRYRDHSTVLEQIDNNQFFPISRNHKLTLVENSVSFSLAVDHVGG